MKKLKVMILHYIIAPYRNPLFEKLSKKYDLTVYFCKENNKDRNWSTKLDNYSFKYKILPHKDVGPFVLNKIFTGIQNYPESLLPKPTWKTKPKEFKDKNVIFHIGYLNERKGVNYLIESFNKLDRKDAVLLIAGTGDQEEKLKELAKDNSNIKFLGYMDGIDKANHYSIADFFVFPTLYDVWGHVVTEALYYGSPVICTDKAEAKELIEEGKTGFIIPDKDSDALAEAMKKLLDNPKLLTQMKENVKKIPKSKIVDIQTTVKTFEDAINYALKHSNETTKTEIKIKK